VYHDPTFDPIFVNFVHISALKSDRDRLKVDKAELLGQIQETQKTIDDKEEQLREFIRDFNQQMKVLLD